MKTGESDNLEQMENPSGSILHRREFLQRLGAGVYVCFSLEDFSAQAQEARGARGYPEDFNAYLRIGEDGQVSCYTGKVEAGQGIIAALAQMLAEELEVPFDSVTMVMGDTKLCPWDMGTFGSRSVKYFGPALRAAGAEAREVLVQLAAEHLRLPEERLTPKDGAVFDRNHPQTRVTYAKLAQGKTIERHLPKKPPLKTPSAFRVCGQSLPRKDAVEKVTGKAQYAGDVRLAGILYGSVLRPPAHGAKLKSLDTAAARSAPGAQVVEDGDLVAVLHAAPDLARSALSLVKAEWDIPEASLDDQNIFTYLPTQANQGDVIAEKGDLAKGREMASVRFDETYRTPYVAHATIETHSALVNVEGKSATVWASTQRPFATQEEVARVVGLPVEQVRVITPYLGAGFGGKSNIRQVLEAARLSKLSGRPVQVVWTREEEFFNDTFQPAAVVKISSGMNPSNRIVFWDYEVLFAGERSSATFYDIPHQRTVSRGAGGRPVHPFGTGAWRGPGSNTNIFARESHMDLMASKAGMDPLEFRLKNLADTRMVRVLKAAADKFGWTAAKAPSGRGHGMACLDYLGTYVAAMAEVQVDKSAGKIQVQRVVIAQDMGTVINPEGARIQMEGCVTMGLGYALAEKIRFRGGKIEDLNFDTYDVTRFSWVPKIETVLVDNPDLAPQGGGEPAITCMGALIANALFDAVGVRLLQLPLSPEKVREGLAARGEGRHL
jgi:nicotinate dehydrogenase subunit B